MNGKIPHVVQYQGSKRMLAPEILGFMPKAFDRLVEPFSGMAAISIAVASENRAKNFWINDINQPLIGLLNQVVNEPEKIIENYSKIWNEQFIFSGGHIAHFYFIRDLFNSGDESPEHMLYLLARCVKGAVRYGKDGKFNQSPDKRRHGTTPNNLAKNVLAISSLLKGKVVFTSLDYKEVLSHCELGDIVYMDPPYQGVSNTRDNRYFSGVDFNEFAESLETLEKKDINYLVSYDGECGGKEYGESLPDSLQCTKVLLNAGLSSQATLLGRKSITFEALYVSNALFQKSKNSYNNSQQLDLFENIL